MKYELCFLLHSVETRGGPVKVPSFLSSQGTIGRARYALIGTFLFALKHNIDRVIAMGFGYEWSVFNYWAFDRSLRGLTEYQARFYAVLLFAALPFIWIGVVLTVRRLSDAGLPVWLVFLFFLPFINLFFFIALSITPTAEKEQQRFTNRGLHRLLLRVVPDSELGSAALGVLGTVIFAVAVTVFSVNRLGNYGWGLFVGLPFFLGLNSVLIYGIHRPRSLGRCLGVAVLSIVFVGGIPLRVGDRGVYLPGNGTAAGICHRIVWWLDRVHSAATRCVRRPAVSSCNASVLDRTRIRIDGNLDWSRQSFV